MWFCRFQYQAKLGIIASDCLFSSSKKEDAAVALQVDLPLGGPLRQYLSSTSLKRMKAWECYIDGGGFFP